MYRFSIKLQTGTSNSDHEQKSIKAINCGVTSRKLVFIVGSS